VSHLAYLGLGSNLGDREAELGAALALLARIPEGCLRRTSSVYESSPLGPVREQPAFLNLVAELETGLEPRPLLARCLEVESARGRVRTRPQGPRSIDLDLLLFDDWVRAWPELVLPHPELARRSFVLSPLLELEPELRDPRTGQRLREAWARLGAQEIRRAER
jgi:2-amino-4-hydroxy-6-hydroxymethyldihydropteridine diphosphokinase